MNRIFKVIWSQTRQKYVVVSELVKRGGWVLLSATQKLALGLAVAGVLAGPAAATKYYYTGTTGTTTPTGCMIIIEGSTVPTTAGSATKTVTIGDSARTAASNTTAVGYNAQAGKVGATAIGNAASADANYSFAGGYNARATGTYAVALGSSLASGLHSFAGGYNSTASGDYSVVIGSGATDTKYINSTVGTLTGTRAIGIGNNAQSLGPDTIVLGSGATTYKTFNTYMGTQSGDTAIAIGKSARSTALNSVGIGTGTKVDSDYSIGIGYDAGSIFGWANAQGKVSDAGYAVNIGTNSRAFTSNGSNPNLFKNAFASVTIGTNVHTHAAYTVAIGTATDATGERSFALGTVNTALLDGDGRPQAHKGSRSAGQGSIAIGDTAEAWSESDPYDNGEQRDLNANDAIAIGTMTRARAVNTITIGGAVSYTEAVSQDGGYVLKTSYGFNKDGSAVPLGTKGNMGYEGAHTAVGADAAIAIGGASATLKTEAARSLRTGGIAIGSGALVGRRDIDWERQAILTSTEYKNALEAYNAAWAAWAPYQEGDIVAPTAPVAPTTAPYTKPEASAYGDDTAAFDAALAAWQAVEDAWTAYNAANAIYNGDETVEGSLAKYNKDYNAASADYAAANTTYKSLRDAIKAQLENLGGQAAPINGVAIGTAAAVEVQGGVALGSYSVVDVSRDRSGNVSGMTGYDPLTGQQYAGADKESGIWKSVWGSVSVGRNGLSDIVQSADNQYYIVGNNGTVYEAYVLSDDGGHV